MGAQRIVAAGVVYLDYLTKTWMPEALWQSWSRKGRLYASTILKVPVEGVLPTTNHLESFNGLLKRKYLPRWQHSGTRLRIDFLIFTLITKILPEIFALRHSIRSYKTWLQHRFQNSAGGVDLVELRKIQKQASPSQRSVCLLCWWTPHSRRDAEAQAIVHLKRIYNINQTLDCNQYEATCVSSRSVLGDPSARLYHIYIHRDGHAGCTCPDFEQNGCACKHLRSFRLIIDSWIAQGLTGPFYYPATLEAAERVPLLSSGPPLLTQPSGAAVLHNFLALQKMAGADPTATVDGEENESGRMNLDDLMNTEGLVGDWEDEDDGPVINDSEDVDSNTGISAGGLVRGLPFLILTSS